MGTVITEALALRRTPFGETSQVAEFLTRERGRLALILKGVHRPRARMGGGVDLLDHCQLVFVARRGSRSLAPLRERKILSHHPGLRSREDLLAGGLCVVELIPALAPEGQRQPALFDAAVALLAALDAQPPRACVPSLVYGWQAQMLRMAGFQPVLDRCVACERRPSGHRLLRCDPARGGIVCSACRESDDSSIPLSSAAAQRLLAWGEHGATPGEELPARLEAQIRRFFECTWAQVLERRQRCHPLSVAP
ncbi:MAG: DNA repair protein RecO [Planctomycetota bacterium]